MKIKHIGLMVCSMLALTTSCNDYLDQEPQDKLTPEKYFTAEADLAAYSINLYGFDSPGVDSYGISVWGYDNNTDNQAGVNAITRWDPGQWKVGDSNPWNFTAVRNCNYFFDQVIPKYNAGKIQGVKENIDHYIGEMHFLRAWAYFNLLKNIGDAPIFTTALPDEESVLMEASKRQPRNKVARFILADLDTAVTMLRDVPPAGQKTRISKDVAKLFRSRVALYEGTFEKYHKGTAFVPGGTGWPGNPADIQGLDIDNEIRYFFTEAAKSAKEVGDKYVGSLAENTGAAEGMDAALKSLNPYYTMFCDVNMEPYKEVLMWRQYNLDKGVYHNIQMQLENNGGGTGWTRGMVNSFLMKNGLPIYASGSGYDPNWEKQGVDATLQNRDDRIRIFTKGDHSVDYYTLAGEPLYFNMNWIVTGDVQTKNVTGFANKKGKYYEARMQNFHHVGTTGFVIFRAAEALLNYMEASYELNSTIDATASNYWKALRRRAGVSEDFNATINATQMAKEAEGDFGAYSHGQLVNATLYNIRRERRDELMGEGMRWADLQRWRACDQINGYQIEGMRFWGSIYETAFGDKTVVDKTGEKGTISPQDVSIYVRPYQIRSVNNRYYNGYKFTPAHYLTPLPQSVFRKTAVDKSNLSSSVVYQNPGWGMVDGEGATAVQ